MKSAAIPEASSLATRRFLVFRLAKRVYALPAETVAEVIRIPAMARVPQAPTALIGLANLRGAVLPIVSLRVMLGIEVEQSAAARAIVLDGGAPVAVVVDAIDGLVTVDAERLETRSAQLGIEAGERLSGAFPLGDGRGAAKILDVQPLLAETFARRTRPERPNAAGGVIATRAPRSSGGGDARLSSPSRSPARNLLSISAPFGRSSRCRPPGGVAARDEDGRRRDGLREQLLPLLSLRGLLGFAPASAGRAREGHRRLGRRRAGRSDRRPHRAVISADPTLIEPLPPVLEARAGGEARINAIYRGEGGRRLISMLAPEQLFREDVMQRLDEVRDGSGPQPQTTEAGEEGQFLVFRLGETSSGCRSRRSTKSRVRRTRSPGCPRRRSSSRA